jgi:hypothetical protein
VCEVLEFSAFHLVKEIREVYEGSAYGEVQMRIALM